MSDQAWLIIFGALVLFAIYQVAGAMKAFRRLRQAQRQLDDALQRFERQP